MVTRTQNLIGRKLPIKIRLQVVTIISLVSKARAITMIKAKETPSTSGCNRHLHRG
jgi:hypothetical protein